MKQRSNVLRKRGATPAIAVAVACMVLPLKAAEKQGGTNDAQKTAAVVKRDPFWPVGYKPKQMVQKEQKGKTKIIPGGSWKEAMKNVVINGVSSRDNEHFAVINGELKSVGDTVSVRLGTSVYTWAVVSIEPPSSVKLRRVSVR